MKLNLGCGPQIVDGWINVDYALGARFMKTPFIRSFNRKVNLFKLDWDENIYIHNLTKRFPWPDSSVDVVYSSHTLEHLSKEEGQRFFKECYRVLRKKGTIRIVVPDLRHVVDEYVEGRIAADDFVMELGVLYSRNNNGLKNHLSPFIQFPHKCMYDSPRLLEILRGMGFGADSRKIYDSDIADIEMIELEERAKNSVIVEGVKL